MSKVTIDNKKGTITIVNKLSYPEAVNERVYNAIASGMFESFLPVFVRQKGKETRIECTVQGMIPLTKYFEGIVDKKMFLDFAHKIALILKSCEKIWSMRTILICKKSRFLWILARMASNAYSGRS